MSRYELSGSKHVCIILFLWLLTCFRKLAAFYNLQINILLFNISSTEKYFLYVIYGSQAIDAFRDI